MHHCEVCDVKFKKRYGLQRHQAGRRHAARVNQQGQGMENEREVNAQKPKRKREQENDEGVPKKLRNHHGNNLTMHQEEEETEMQQCRKNATDGQEDCYQKGALPRQDPNSPHDVRDKELAKLLSRNDDVAAIFQNSWTDIRTSYRKRINQRQLIYNLRISNSSRLPNFLHKIHGVQKTAYRINIWLGFILRNGDGKHTYYYPSSNTKVFRDDQFITSQVDFDHFMQETEEKDVEEMAKLMCTADSKDCFYLMTNFQVMVTRLYTVPLGCGKHLPLYLKNMRSVIGLDYDRRGKRLFDDQKCFFRCLALHRGYPRGSIERPTKHYVKRWCRYKRIIRGNFNGITVEEIDDFEKLFGVGVDIYSLEPAPELMKQDSGIVEETDQDEDEEDTELELGFDGDLDEDIVRQEEQNDEAANAGYLAAILIRRHKLKSKRVMKVNLNGLHFSYIKKFSAYSKAFLCCKCRRPFKKASDLERHQRKCSGVTVKHKFVGGGYRNNRTIMDELELENIPVSNQLRYFPFYACFDFESLVIPVEGGDNALALDFEISGRLPREDPRDSPRNQERLIRKNWQSLRTRFSKSGPSCVIRNNPEIDLTGCIAELVSQVKSRFSFSISYISRFGKEIKKHRLFATTDDIRNEHQFVSMLAELQEKNEAIRRKALAYVLNFKEKKESILYKQVVASGSIACNVPGYLDCKGKCSPIFMLSKGCPAEFTKRWLEKLESISDDAAEIMKNKLEPQMNELIMRLEYFKNEAKQLRHRHPELRKAIHTGKRKVNANWQNVPELDKDYFVFVTQKISRYEHLIKMLNCWIRELPVVGFNSSRFDLQIVREYLMPLLIERKQADKDTKLFTIRKSNAYMLLSTGKLRFLDQRNYIAPNYDYAAFIASQGITVKKSHWPYIWFSGLEKLKETELPSYDHFYSEIKSAYTLTPKEYVELKKLWKKRGFRCMKDLLRYYNDLDVVPFTEALAKQKAWWAGLGIDMLKDGLSLPGLSLLDLFKRKPEHVHFTLETDSKHHDSSDLFFKLKESMTGGPSLVFCRYHERDKTFIKGNSGKLTKSILGFDCNSMYLEATMDNHATGIGYRYFKKDDEPYFHKKSLYPYSREEREYVSWQIYSNPEAEGTLHKFNNFTPGAKLGPYYPDGLSEKKKTVIEYNGCNVHKHICKKTVGNNWSDEEVKMQQEHMEAKRKFYKKCGYKLIETYQCEWEREKRSNPAIQKFLKENFHMPNYWRLTEKKMLDEIQAGRFFGVVDLQINTPDHLREKFSPLPPVFKNREISQQDLVGVTAEQAKCEGRLKRPTRTLLSSYFADRILLATPLLKFYLDQGLHVNKIYSAFQFKPMAPFKEIGLEIAQARRNADNDKSQKPTSDLMKLKGNSLYGKTITDVSKHISTILCNEVDTERHLRDPFFSSLDPVSTGFNEITLRHKTIVNKLPHMIGFFVYQLAKLKILNFVYNCLLKFWDESDVDFIAMDTDSMYFAFSGTPEEFESKVKPELRQEFNRVRNEFFPSNESPEATKYDNRTPGKYKREFAGTGMVALNSKCYYCWDDVGYQSERVKMSSKGLPKTNRLTKEQYLSVLFSGKVVSGKVHSIRRVRKSRGVYSTRTIRYGLTSFYAKRILEDDLIRTRPYQNL